MRPPIWPVAAILTLAACHQSTEGDAVREAYDNHAEAVDRKAAEQSTPTARKIYEARADAIREEGKDRAKGLAGGTPSAGQGAETAAASGGAR